MEAQKRLDAIDQRRSDPQYRAGLNDEANRLPISTPVSPQTSSVFGADSRPDPGKPKPDQVPDYSKWTPSQRREFNRLIENAR